MTRSCLRPALLYAALALVAPAAWAQSAQTPEQAEAQQHFQRAKDLYQQGHYTEAVRELERARGLDPKAKDLVFNLGIVHEKLGRFDEAIEFFRQYMQMDGVNAPEKAKAESIIKRIEGAKRELAASSPPSRGEAPESADGDEPARPRSVSPAEQAAPRHGRVDALTIAAGTVAVLGLGTGAFFGVRALTTRPTDFVTGRDGTYADFQQRNDDAHTSAVVADLALGVGVVAALATAWLYFGRTRAPERAALRLGPGVLVGTFR